MQPAAPFFAPLVEELAARNRQLLAGERVAQLGFSCIEAWIAAAARAFNASTTVHSTPTQM